MIDWTKPIRHARSKHPAELIYTMNGHSYPRVIVVTREDGTQWTHSYPSNTTVFENVPDPPASSCAGRWFNLYLTDNGIRVYGGTYETEEIARDCLSQSSEDKYIATLQIPDVPAPPVEPEPEPDPAWATPGLKVEVGKFYRTRDGRKAEVTSYDPKARFPYRVAVDGKHVATVLPCGTVWGKFNASDNDLVAEWVEPEPTPAAVFANVYQVDNGSLLIGDARFKSHAEAAAYGLARVHGNANWKRLVATFQVS